MTGAPRSLGSELQKGTTPLLVLSVIGEGELYGYEIAKRIRDRSSGAFAPSEGSLYPTLHRLEADGALTASWRASDVGPRRRYYRLTRAGHRQLTASLDEWRTFTAGVARIALAEGSRG
jgi:PadR family transcriptional regulator PadR